MSDTPTAPPDLPRLSTADLAVLSAVVLRDPSSRLFVLDGTEAGVIERALDALANAYLLDNNAEAAALAHGAYNTVRGQANAYCDLTREQFEAAAEAADLNVTWQDSRTEDPPADG